MRNLVALVACSFVISTASANDPPNTAPSAAKPAVESVKAASAPAKPVYVPRLSPAAQRAQDEQAEADLAAKIAERLAAMRANQAARVAAASKARKASEAKRKKAEQTPVVRNGTHWSYEGEHGPANWVNINSEWGKCGTGKRQSPINIRDGMKVDLEPIAFEYKPSSFSVIDNGHTIQVSMAGGNYLTVQNRAFELVEFHFHRPSEERINGKGFEMVVHLVHKDIDGQLGVLALLLERGKQQDLIQTVWNNLPLEKNLPVNPALLLDMNELLPQKREYFTYMGSMTTPPCSEDVLWLVMKQPVQASPAQMALFSRLYPFNARPIQASAGRVIKESN